MEDAVQKLSNSQWEACCYSLTINPIKSRPSMTHKTHTPKKKTVSWGANNCESELHQTTCILSLLEDNFAFFYFYIFVAFSESLFQSNVQHKCNDWIIACQLKCSGLWPRAFTNDSTIFNLYLIFLPFATVQIDLYKNVTLSSLICILMCKVRSMQLKRMQPRLHTFLQNITPIAMRQFCHIKLSRV